ncbi:CTP synthase [candidate division WOR-3 bacterium]|uniref:CTP synthase n=1 Tax=candidate division WOR-3 bacterium TaxID=2052148 RepID=A0A9D5KAU2_UNCW3|nr:CTP synthase [candidate division WOR-3 bacterium]MBD3364804.1 CTP synthase [candidate division WOR-3 bacterium]
MAKYIFVTGGVVSSLGKGIAASSIGLLLKSRGFRVTMQKFDPYINVDPGTMNPYQHGEVFVTQDGAETDLDLGHYERFIDENLTKDNNHTTGQIYESIINKERKGLFLGGTVQVVPHITNEIKQRITRLSSKQSLDVVISEIGGTVGDIEGQPFLEAIRQLRLDLGPKNVLYVHVTLVPFIPTSGEFKTKPTQHSVKELRTVGIQPDIIIARSLKRIPRSARDKISLFCSVETEAVIDAPDVKSIYMVPLNFHEQDLDKLITAKLGLPSNPIDLSAWRDFSQREEHRTEIVRIALVGKYTGLKDAYKSVLEALEHAAIAEGLKIDLVWVESSELNEDSLNKLYDVDGILVPGGFGTRGIEGKIKVARYARDKGKPYLGLCVGLQVAVIEYARDVCGLSDANSTEFNAETPHPVIDLMPEQKNVYRKGGTMRLGSYPCVLKPGSKAQSCYGKEVVFERHRHRYEVNPAYVEKLQASGLEVSGVSPDGLLVEIVELSKHPFFVATQFHPEFLSRPLNAHPLFATFIKEAHEYVLRAQIADSSTHKT